jgi:hypothetical protein
MRVAIAPRHAVAMPRPRPTSTAAPFRWTRLQPQRLQIEHILGKSRTGPTICSADALNKRSPDTHAHHDERLKRSSYYKAPVACPGWIETAGGAASINAARRLLDAAFSR